MEVEVHDVDSAIRGQLSHRLQSYRTELSRLNKEFVRPLLNCLLCVCVCIIILCVEKGAGSSW